MSQGPEAFEDGGYLGTARAAAGAGAGGGAGFLKVEVAGRGGLFDGAGADVVAGADSAAIKGSGERAGEE
ncbi:MAG TPA: hypothetical protein VHM90_12080, partial [Phycisphaerae bacterium]|nr:hypothetical protein [Phycisphaerae bacterium]